MKDTREEIVRIANELLRTKGYTAFSYADISKQLHIKNATIHYYFPSKADLGLEIIKGATARFVENRKESSHLSCKEQFKLHLQTYNSLKDNSWLCLMGAFCSSFDSLSEEMRQELKKQGNIILDWLTDLFEKGKASGEFHFVESPKAKAYLVQSSIVASLQLQRIVDNNAYQIIYDSILNL